MLWLSHTHAASASLAAVRLDHWLADGPCLCVAQHSSLSIVSLTSVHGAPGDTAVYPPLSCVLRMPLNARILTIQAVPAVAGSDAHRTDRIAVLTDHPVPRLLVLRPATAAEVAQQENKSSPWSRIITEVALDLAEASRPPAELGLGLAIEKAVATSPSLASVWTVSHVYRGQLQVMPLSQAGAAQDKRVSDVGAAFLVRLPHPVLIGMTFLERQGDAPTSVLALLSLSSKPSKIPGFGEQCLPVLSFHRLDGASQQLESVPWGAPRRAPVHTDPSSSSETGSASTGRASGPGKRGKRQPSAVGRRLDAKERNAREQEWADDPLTRAHVPLPHDDALGAHLLCGVPAAAGGGVIVFCEHCVLYVPPPGTSTQRGAKTDANVTTKAKQHGSENTQRQKRRRLHPEDDELEQDSVSVDDTMPQLLRIGVKKPMCVVASTVVHDYAPRDQANASPCVPIVFATSDGRLYVLVLYGDASGKNECWSPRGLRIACIGSSSTAAGPNGLTYIGEGFVHVSSALSDSVLLYAPALVDGEVDALAAPQSSPVTTGAATEASQLFIVRRWTNIGPVVDFVVDRGDSDKSDVSGIYERTITCSGAGPQCSLRVVRSGVSADEIGALSLPECLQVFAVDKWTEDASASSTALIILCYASHTQILAPAADGFQDVSDTFAGVGLNLGTRALHVKPVRGWQDSSFQDYGFVYVAAEKVYAVSRSSGGDLRVHTWAPPGQEPRSEILCCDVNSVGKVLVGLQSGHLASLAFSSDGARDERMAEFPTALATASLLPGADEYAVVGTWEPHGLMLVRSQDLTPIAGGEDALVALDAPITSVLATTFDPQSNDVHVIAGLDSGDIVVFRVEKGTSAPALHKVKSMNLGHQPVSLTRFPTGGLSAVPEGAGVLALGVKSLVVYMVGGQLCFSELRYSHVRSATPLQVTLQPEQSTEPVLALVVQDQVIFTLLHSLQQLDIRTVPLGASQPTAIQRLPSAHVLAVNTWQAHAHERGEEVFGHVRLFSDQSLQELHSYQLQRNERPNCMTSVTVGDEDLLVVGTGFNDPKRLETTSGRILGFRVQSEKDAVGVKSLSPVFATDVPGNVYASTSIGGRLVAAVDAQVIVYAVQRDKETGELSISVCSRWGCSFIASCLANSVKDRNVLVVGDAMRSLTVLSVDHDTGEITELARDLDPYWTTAVETYDDKAQQYLGSDIAMNVFVSKRIPIVASNAIDAPAKDSWSRVMRRDACFHYGDMINKFERVDLLEPLSVAPDASQIRFCTAAGSLGALTKLPQSLSEMLDCVQTAMTRVMPSCGNIPVEE
mgnify:CR=1 FL=1